jgi:hypothetical protein
MANLYELVDDAHDGESLAALGREFQLTPQQTEAAVAALLPAISAGLKQSTATFDGLGNLLAMMGQQQHLHALYDDPEAALGAQGVAAGNDVLSTIFGSPAVTQGVVDHAQQFSGVSSGILKKLLPVLAGIVISGLMRSGSSGKPAAPQSPPPSGGGALGDILGQIFGRGMPGAPAGRSSPTPLPPLPQSSPRPSAPPPSSFPPSAPGETSGAGGPEGDLLGHVLRELEKGIREGRIKPVVIGGGPIQIPVPGGPMPSQPDAPQMPGQPGGDILGQILRDVFGGAIGSGGPLQMPQGRSASPPAKDLSDLSKQLGLMGGAGAALFGGRLDHGQDVDRSHLDNIQSVFDRFLSAQR